MTNDICGQSSAASSLSAILQSSLENKLRQKVDVNGSPEYVLTWKHWDMESGPPICALRARGRRTSDNDCSGWPSPNTPSGGRSVSIEKMDATGKTPDGKKHTASLEHAVKFTGWPTPNIPNRGAESRASKQSRGSGGVDLQTAAQLTGWNTPRATDGSKGGPNQSGGALPADAAVAGWATPANRDSRYSNAKSYQKRSQSKKGEQPNNQVVHGLTQSPSTAVTEKPAGLVLNSAFSRWLMGFPQGSLTSGWDTLSPGWESWATVQKLLNEFCEKPDETELDACEDTEIRSFLKSQPCSSNQLSKSSMTTTTATTATPTSNSSGD